MYNPPAVLLVMLFAQVVVGGVEGSYDGLAVSPLAPSGTQLDIDWVGSTDQNHESGLGLRLGLRLG